MWLSIKRELTLHKRATRIASVWLLLTTFMLLLSGCTITTVIEPPQDGYTIAGVAVFGWRDLLLDDATITISGPQNEVVYTDANGLFSVSDLPEGHYTVTVDSLAGRASQQLYLSRDTNLTLRVPYPSGLDESTFLMISGLWEYTSVNGRLVTTAGSGNWRWRLGTNVPIYINDISRPAGFQSYWPNEVWSYIHYSPAIADIDISTTRSNYPQNYDIEYGIEIEWVPANSLDGIYGVGTVGVTRLMSLDDDGYLEHVLVLIDVQYGDLTKSSVLGHEIMHSIGANHVDEPDSLLYPYAEDGQRLQLTSDEAYHLKYAFAVAPGQSVPYSAYASMGASSIGAQGVQSQSVRATKAPKKRVVTVMSSPGKPSQVIDGVPEGLMQHKRVRELFGDSTQAGPKGFLWDKIAK